MYDPFTVRLSGAGADLAPGHADEVHCAVASTVSPKYSWPSTEGTVDGCDEEAAGTSFPSHDFTTPQGRSLAAVADKNPELREQSPPAEASPLTERLGEDAQEFTVYVPTMFTTANGKPICLREQRRLPVDCTYVQFLSKAGEAALASEPRAALMATADAGEKESHQSHLIDHHWRTEEGEEHMPTWGWRPWNTQAALVLDSIHTRAHSCPMRVASLDETMEDCEDNEGHLDARYSTHVPVLNGLHLHTGFTLANGHPLYRHR